MVTSHTSIRVCVRAPTQSLCERTQMHPCTHAHTTHALACVYICAHIDSNTHTHVCAHGHTHAHTYPCMGQVQFALVSWDSWQQIMAGPQHLNADLAFSVMSLSQLASSATSFSDDLRRLCSVDFQHSSKYSMAMATPYTHPSTHT